jgi:hypothetical protein
MSTEYHNARQGAARLRARVRCGAIVSIMIGLGRGQFALGATLVAVALASASTFAASAGATTTTPTTTPTPTQTAPTTATPSASARALLDSHELWATIDVCNTPKQANTVGIRGSMPGDGKAHDKLYMSFRLQYLNASTNTWIDLASGATPAFVPVGAGATARQDGTSFQLVPVAGKPAVTLRGVVDFQWRRGKKILLTAARPTTAGRKSLAGAEPAGYSAASCVVG